MCGISGFFNVQAQDAIEKMRAMSHLIEHRGPDQYGEFVSSDGRTYLAHQRLSILDLTEAGAQPMYSPCQRYVIVFNGEIYNFIKLREELNQKDPNTYWAGHSDTEVLVRCISIFGLEKTLPKLNGMFAFALLDLQENTLTLARDRFGEKPLYIYADNTSFAFSSELKPIELFTNNLHINQNAINTLLQYSYIPAPHSIYHEVFKLLPGHYLTINLENFDKPISDNAQAYWQICDTVAKGLSNRNQFSSIIDAIETTSHVLSQSVKDRMVSDVPLGAFLSGGIDSTCITSLMQDNSSQKIKTYSIGFNDKNYNEADHAKTVANILGTEHHELYLDANDMLDFVPSLANIYDEPFADSSQLPTLMVSQFAKKEVTVALTGDAGDEVFCGYNRYVLGQSLVNKLSPIPKFLLNGIQHATTAISPNVYNKIASALSILIPKLKKQKRIGDNIHKLARVINFTDEADLYSKLILTWPEIGTTGEIIDIATDITHAFNYHDITLAERMMWQDSIGYLQNDILTKVDRASMAVSLETRVPFLDNDVFEHAWSLPIEYKLHQGLTKYPLRKIISNYIPNNIMNKPKAGFGVPIHQWLRHELNDWAENLLSEDALNSSSLLNTKKIRKLWQSHLNGQVNEQYALWNVLMFQQWHNKKAN